MSQLSVQANKINKLKMFLQKGNIPFIVALKLRLSRQDVMGASVYQAGERSSRYICTKCIWQQLLHFKRMLVQNFWVTFLHFGNQLSMFSKKNINGEMRMVKFSNEWKVSLDISLEKKCKWKSHLYKSDDRATKPEHPKKLRWVEVPNNVSCSNLQVSISKKWYMWSFWKSRPFEKR